MKQSQLFSITLSNEDYIEFAVVNNNSSIYRASVRRSIQLQATTTFLPIQFYIRYRIIIFRGWIIAWKLRLSKSCTFVPSMWFDTPEAIPIRDWWFSNWSRLEDSMSLSSEVTHWLSAGAVGASSSFIIRTTRLDVNPNMHRPMDCYRTNKRSRWLSACSSGMRPARETSRFVPNLAFTDAFQRSHKLF